MTTERLTVRRIASDDWESMKEIWDDQRRSVYARFDRPNDTNPDAVRQRIGKWASCENSTEHMFFAVCLNGGVIGYIAFNRREDGYETGYCFHSDYQGKGYAKESMAALIGAILEKQPDAVITARTALKNIPSVRLLQSQGFRLTGTEKVSFYRDEDGKKIDFDGGIYKRLSEFHKNS